MPREIRIDPEPLSDARWAKIEQAVYDRLDDAERPASIAAPKRPSRWRAAAVVVAAATIAAIFGALAMGAWSGRAPASLASHVETGTSGTHVAIGEAELDVGPASALLVRGDDAHGVIVVLDRGRVECEVAPRRGRPPFVVQAGEVSVRVVGTHFSVERVGDGADVEVTRGTVEVTSRGEVHGVHAGERWPATPAPSAAPSTTTSYILMGPPLPRPSEPPPPRKAASEPRIDTPPATAATAEPSRAATTRGDPAPLAPSAATPEDTSLDVSLTAPTTAAPAPPSSPAPPAAPPATPATPATPAPTGPTPRARYDAAARLEASDPAAALAQYHDLARGSGPWAANALYAAGRLEADRGARAEATRSLTEYLTRFPRGANAADARDLLDRLQRASR